MGYLLKGMLVALLLFSATGCDGSTSNRAGRLDTRTPAEYFMQQQAATVTPHGKILVDTVAEVNGMIEYSTEDGTRWRVSYSRLADGTYQYGMPEAIRR